MTTPILLILLAALVLDWFVGDPPVIWQRVPHPVALFGRAVDYLDRRLNLPDINSNRAYRNGALSLVILVLSALIFALLLQQLLAAVGMFGWIIEVLIVAVLLAQKSLHDHVRSVAIGLRNEGLAGGREAIGRIVGRDPELLDEPGMCRAAIESLAENFSDGVVAPAFWYAVFGLPGIFVYKMINTADSMIAYRSQKYLNFGRVTAQVDDLANWLPARLSAAIIALAGFVAGGMDAAKRAVSVALRDAGLHRSPNAGWPEAAMAGATGIALGGPRQYSGETVQQAYINSSGQRDLTASDIDRALTHFRYACCVLWAIVMSVLILYNISIV